jgi:hypothetical protein
LHGTLAYLQSHKNSCGSNLTFPLKPIFLYLKGGKKMNKLFCGTIFLALAIAVPVSATAGVSIGFGISLPPPVVFHAPPEVIVLPDTDDVYVVPDIDVDIYFWGGWWWRFWDGRWYRSHYYDRDWGYYSRVPSFYFDIDPGWRRYYRDRNWYGHRWNYERIPDQRRRANWQNWKTNRYWERRRTWGVQDYRLRPQRERRDLRYQRQKQYRQMPEVRRHMQQRQPDVRQRRDRQRERGEEGRRR